MQYVKGNTGTQKEKKKAGKKKESGKNTETEK
jgi:hypothetical protein